MPGQLSGTRSRKRRPVCGVKMSRKAPAARKASAKRPRTSRAAAAAAAEGSGRREGEARISCECQQAAGARRCSASPGPEGREGKENEDGPEEEQPGGVVFPDDDSNQILPVEQFFGNMDIVQDFPQRRPKSSGHAPRGSRRRHFYAREDDEDGDGDGPVDQGGDT